MCVGIGPSLPGSDFQLQDSLAMKLTTIKIKKKNKNQTSFDTCPSSDLDSLHPWHHGSEVKIKETHYVKLILLKGMPAAMMIINKSLLTDDYRFQTHILWKSHLEFIII